MGEIKLLDCTLSDGGFTDNYLLSSQRIPRIINGLVDAKIDFVNLGFLKNEPYQSNRTVFNSLEQANRLIVNDSYTQYVVTIDAISSFSTKKLKRVTANGIKTICVMIDKTKSGNSREQVDFLQEEYAYCKEIVKMGYRICILPTQVDQYTDKEFVSMLRLFSGLHPYAFYVVDNWGTQTSSQLMHYFDMADNILESNIMLGYYGCNNMSQVFTTSCALIGRQYRRDVIINASIAGRSNIGECLELELMVSYMNGIYVDKYNLDAIIDVYDIVSNSKKIGYLSAITHSNPQYGKYYEKKSCLSNKDIKTILSDLSFNNLEKFSQKEAENYYLKYMREKWNKKICIAVITENCSEAIQYMLEKEWKSYSELAIDIIIYDYSDNNNTKGVVQKISKRENSTIIYYQCAAEEIEQTLEQRAASIYKKLGDRYEYVWVCTELQVINIKSICNDLDLLWTETPEVIVVYDNSQNRKGLEKVEIYEDCCEAFEKHYLHMVSIGTCIFSRKFIKKLNGSMNEEYIFWQPMALFDYWANHEMKVISYVGAVFDFCPYYQTDLVFKEEDNLIYKWSSGLYSALEQLPQCYNTCKDKIVKLCKKEVDVFNPRSLTTLRAHGNLNFKQFYQNKDKIELFTSTPLWKIVIRCIVPRFICKYYFNNPNSLLVKFLQVIYSKIEKIYMVKYHDEDELAPIFRLGEVQQSKNEMYQEVYFEKKSLCIFIPTCNRAKQIKDHLYELGKLYCAYGVDVIIYDSSDNDETEKIVKDWSKESKNTIRYERYTESEDDKSIDAKVMSLYKKYSNKYEYLWVLRDKSGVNLNSCAVNLIKIIAQKPDMISIHNYTDDYYNVKNKKYTECRPFFKEQFNSTTTLGNTIVRGTFIKRVLDEVPLDQEKNYGLWQPIAFFEYCARHEFSAISCVGNIFIYHKTALAGSFWQKQLLYQWVERFYKMLHLLPAVYTDELYPVILEWNNRYGLLDVPYLLAMHAKGYVNINEVKLYSDIIPYISRTPVDYYEQIARMSTREAAHLFKCWGAPNVRKRFEKMDHHLLGAFEAIG